MTKKRVVLRGMSLLLAGIMILSMGRESIWLSAANITEIVEEREISTGNDLPTVYLAEDFEGCTGTDGELPDGFEMTGNADAKLASSFDKTDTGTSARLQIADTVDLSTTPDVTHLFVL